MIPNLSVCARPSLRRPCVNEFVRAIIHRPFKLGSPYYDYMCKRTWLRFLLFCGVIDLDLQGQVELKMKSYPIWACPRDNSPLTEVRISKFGPQMHISTAKIPINIGLDWTWPMKSIFITNWDFICIVIFSIYLVRPLLSRLAFKSHRTLVLRGLPWNHQRTLSKTCR